MLNDLTRERWKTRRRMAWVAFGALLMQTPLLMFMDKDWITSASGILISVVGFLAGIVMVYIGAATVDDIKIKGGRNDTN